MRIYFTEQSTAAPITPEPFVPFLCTNSRTALLQLLRNLSECANNTVYAAANYVGYGLPCVMRPGLLPDFGDGFLSTIMDCFALYRPDHLHGPCDRSGMECPVLCRPDRYSTSKSKRSTEDEVCMLPSEAASCLGSSSASSGSSEIPSSNPSFPLTRPLIYSNNSGLDLR